MNGWIPFGEPYKPAENELVLVYAEPDLIALRVYDGEKFLDSKGIIDDVFKWSKYMAIPHPEPEREDE